MNFYDRIFVLHDNNTHISYFHNNIVSSSSWTAANYSWLATLKVSTITRIPATATAIQQYIIAILDNATYYVKTKKPFSFQLVSYIIIVYNIHLYNIKSIIPSVSSIL